MLYKDNWLSKILKKNVYQINENNIKSFQNTDFPPPPALVVAKLPVNAFDLIYKLQNLDFYIVDTNIQFKKKLDIIENKLNNVRYATKKDLTNIIKIAESQFKFDRFHNDPLIPDDIASKIKSEWVKNFFSSRRGDWMIVAEAHQKIRGFLLLLRGNDGSVIIDLIAVENSYCKLGLASNMIKFAFSNCKSENCIYRVGTQLSNKPSIALYTKMGFNLCSAKFVLHKHI